MKLTVLLAGAATVALLAAPVAGADPGQDGRTCIPFLGCGTWNVGSGDGGSGCIDRLGCADGNLGDLSGCVTGAGCGSFRP
jgi:hypothetical protein